MPDSNLADGSVLTSSFYNTYVREQVIVTCTAATRPTGVEGRRIFETDTNKEYIYDGSAWRLVGGSAWTSYTPSWTNLTVGNGTQAAEYRYVVGGIRVRGMLTFGTTTSISGDISQTIPNSETGRSTACQALGGAKYFDSGTRDFLGMTVASSSATTFVFRHTESGNLGIVNATNPMTWTTSDVLSWDITVTLD